MSVKAFLKTWPLLLLAACKDGQDPVVTIVPEPVVSDNRIDQFYYVQFAWGKTSLKDTLTFEVPDDTSSWNLQRDYMNLAAETRNEAIVDTSLVGEVDPPYEKIGWHYAPASFLYPRAYIEYLEKPGGNPEEFKKVNKRIFSISFPWVLKGTENASAFWDIEDYLSNPFIAEGNIRWGRVGNNEEDEVIWNNDAQNGVVISYIDENGELWRSDFHPTYQPFGYFNIRKVSINDHDPETYNLIEGECAARLYNAVGYHKDLRGGKFRLKILTDTELGMQPD